MELIAQLIAFVLVPLLLGTGFFLTLGLRFLPLRWIGRAFRETAAGRKPEEGAEGTITPFQALTRAMAATIGTGNIAGVATAIVAGGPGAVFWIWMTAVVGMATKYSETVLAVKYREKDAHGRYVGGPMHYIQNGLGNKWRWLAMAFALFAALAAFGIGNMVQSNSVAIAVQANLDVPPLYTGLVMAALTFVVIVGGIGRIGTLAQHLVPFMGAIYVLGALIIIALNITAVPDLLGTIVTSAFTGHAAVGGFLGATVLTAIQHGVNRGIFSNEAGLGSGAIIHATARTNDPVRQGTVAMLGTFIDTIVVCTMTALVILLVQIPYGTDAEGFLMGAWASGMDSSELTSVAFEDGLAGGEWIVTGGLAVFAFSTVLGWAYYGERSANYLFGPRIVVPYRIAWVGALVAGAVLEWEIVWGASAIANSLMAIPNLIALLLLSGTVFALTRAHRQAERSRVRARPPEQAPAPGPGGPD